MLIGYPSKDFPGPPHIAMPLPENWAGVHLPDTLFAVRDADGESDFVSNIVVRARRHAPQSAAELFEALTTQTASNEVERREMFDLDPPVLYRVVQTRVDGQDISQHHMLALVEQSETELMWAVSIVGSAGSGDDTKIAVISKTLRETRVGYPSYDAE